MKPTRLIAFTVFSSLAIPLSAHAADPLPSNDGPAKQAIVDFVRATTVIAVAPLYTTLVQ